MRSCPAPSAESTARLYARSVLRRSVRDARFLNTLFALNVSCGIGGMQLRDEAWSLAASIHYQDDDEVADETSDLKIIEHEAARIRALVERREKVARQAGFDIGYAKGRSDEQSAEVYFRYVERVLRRRE
jgi:hypothetical protein